MNINRTPTNEVERPPLVMNAATSVAKKPSLPRRARAPRGLGRRQFSKLIRLARSDVRFGSKADIRAQKVMSALLQKRTFVFRSFSDGTTPISAAHLVNNRVGTADSRRVACSTDDSMQQRRLLRLRLHKLRHDMLCAARRQHK